jgi:aerobic-type carbon monoxide dehydrogenase small subunit (CoxS/CutS family)
MSETSAQSGGGLAVIHHAPGRSANAKTAGSGPIASAAAVKKKFTITVNGKKHTVNVTGDTPLLYILRDYIGLTGPHFGCGLSECGACAVLLNGTQIRSCIWPINKVGKLPVVSLEGLHATYHGTNKKQLGNLHPLQKAWIDKQVPQCGYCQSGMMIQAADLLSKKLNPTTAEIKKAMNGHLCRCGTYFRIVDAIHEAARTMREGGLKIAAPPKTTKKK